jgi:hypothetical protein
MAGTIRGWAPAPGKHPHAATWHAIRTDDRAGCGASTRYEGALERAAPPIGAKVCDRIGCGRDRARAAQAVASAARAETERANPTADAPVCGKCAAIGTNAPGPGAHSPSCKAQR